LTISNWHPENMRREREMRSYRMAEAVEATEAVQRYLTCLNEPFQGLRTAEDSVCSGRPHVRAISAPAPELFARSYAQLVAMESQNADFLTEMAILRATRGA